MRDFRAIASLCGYGMCFGNTPTIHPNAVMFFATSRPFNTLCDCSKVCLSCWDKISCSTSKLSGPILGHTVLISRIWSAIRENTSNVAKEWQSLAWWSNAWWFGAILMSQLSPTRLHKQHVVICFVISLLMMLPHSSKSVIFDFRQACCTLSSTEIVQ